MALLDGEPSARNRDSGLMHQLDREWSVNKQMRFISAVIEHHQLEALSFSRHEFPDGEEWHEVVDGSQRIRAIGRFLYG